MTTAITTTRGLLKSESIQARFREILGEKAPAFLSTVIQVSSASHLQKADPQSVLSAAVVAACLDLPVDPNLGFAAIVPYGNSAQFQIMTKGFIQLAWRSGQYKNINVTEVYEGELVKHDRVRGIVEIDPDKRLSDRIIGYCAYFSLINGAEKFLYMTVDDIDKHGKRFSKSYQRGQWGDKEKGGYEAMCRKTVIKRLLSHYGILSPAMVQAIRLDQATIEKADSNNLDEIEIAYPDNPSSDGDKGELFGESEKFEVTK